MLPIVGKPTVHDLGLVGIPKDKLPPFTPQRAVQVHDGIMRLMDLQIKAGPVSRQKAILLDDPMRRALSQTAASDPRKHQTMLDEEREMTFKDIRRRVAEAEIVMWNVDLFDSARRGEEALVGLPLPAEAIPMGRPQLWLSNMILFGMNGKADPKAARIFQVDFKAESTCVLIEGGDGWDMRFLPLIEYYGVDPMINTWRERYPNFGRGSKPRSYEAQLEWLRREIMECIDLDEERLGGKLTIGDTEQSERLVMTREALERRYLKISFAVADNELAPKLRAGEVPPLHWRTLGPYPAGKAIPGYAAFLIAPLLFMGESIAATTRERLHPGQEKDAKRRGKTIPTIKRVVLRRLVRESNGKPETPSGREYSCQWAVRGHWRQQPYRKTGEVRAKYIKPYVKGPTDKPLRNYDVEVIQVRR